MSRLKSAPAARRGAAGRPAASQRGVYVQQPKSDVFVAMLGIALGAIIIGCLLLLLVWGRYDYSTTVSAVVQPSTGTALANVATSHFHFLG